VRFVNVSNPAAYGVEWRSGTSRYQLVNLRGTTSLIYGLNYGGEWLTVPVVDPERFGLTEPPKSFSEFRAIAERYVNS